MMGGGCEVERRRISVFGMMRMEWVKYRVEGRTVLEVDMEGGE